MKLYELFLLFYCYAFFGWIIEVFFEFFKSKKFVNRGFLIGPYCPIYGVGGLIATLTLTQHKDNIIILFVMSMFLFAILEYFTSYLMEKLFKARWWDYSNYRFNIDGRICLETLVPFGLLGCFAIYIVNPCFKYLFNLANPLVLKTIVLILSLIFILDLILSLKIISSFKNTALAFLKKDNTEEITKKVKEVLLSKSVWTKRLIQAFPKVKAAISNINIDFIKTKLELKNVKKELKETKKELHKKEKELKKEVKKNKKWR